MDVGLGEVLDRLTSRPVTLAARRIIPLPSTSATRRALASGVFRSLAVVVPGLAVGVEYLLTLGDGL
jgi:hypothetical protein